MKDWKSGAISRTPIIKGVIKIRSTSQDETDHSKVGKRRLVAAVVSVLIIIMFATVFIYNQDHALTQTEPLFSYASPESAGITNSTMDELAATVQGYFDEDMIVGAELLVIKENSIILHEAVGWKDMDEEVPMERNTLFNIRSMTKPVTGAAIQALIDEGRISLDTKASDYITGFDNENSSNITVELLLSHMSGLPLSLMTSVDQYETLQLLANATGEVGPQFTPGSKFWYSDAGTEVLGAIIELETDMPLDDFISGTLLEPLGMNNSFYYHPGTANDSRKSDIADLYYGSTGEWINVWSPEEPFYPFVFGSQGLYSTPLDYAKFIKMLMNE